MTSRFRDHLWASLVSCALVAVGACGGGGSSSSPPPATPPPEAPPPTVEPPAGLSYSNPNSFEVGEPIDPLTPTVTGTVSSYSVDPPLPGGLVLDTSSGEISGTPSAGISEATFTISASNGDGRADFDLLITVVLERSMGDRDDLFVDAYQVHAIYAVPADGQDRRLDVDGTIEHSLRSSNAFLLSASGSQSIRYDESIENLVDVSFSSLPEDDAHYANMGVFARDALEVDVAAAGFDDPRKMYLVYYDGTNPDACGGAPPLGIGAHIAALYLRGTPPGAPPCESNPFATTNSSPAGYWEWSAAHELIHGFGYIHSCSPHHFHAHTNDNPQDLMYAGDEPWTPTGVDPGQDDYYGANVPAVCPRNLFNSAFLFPQQGDEVPPEF